MKKAIALMIIIIAACSGCTSISVETSTGTKIRVIRFMSDCAISIDREKGTITYTNNVDHDALKAIARGIVEGIKP